MSNFQKWGPFILRMILGAIFTYEGWSKFLGMWAWFGGAKWEFINMVDSITFLVILSPAVWAMFATLAELIGGLLCLIGFRIRLAALMVGTVMVVAILGFHLPHGHSIQTLEKPIALLAMATSLLFTGPGRYYLEIKRQ